MLDVCCNDSNSSTFVLFLLFSRFMRIERHFERRVFRGTPFFCFVFTLEKISIIQTHAADNLGSFWNFITLRIRTTDFLSWILLFVYSWRQGPRLWSVCRFHTCITTNAWRWILFVLKFMQCQDWRQKSWPDPAVACLGIEPGIPPQMVCGPTSGWTSQMYIHKCTYSDIYTLCRVFLRFHDWWQEFSQGCTRTWDHRRCCTGMCNTMRTVSGRNGAKAHKSVTMIMPEIKVILQVSAEKKIWRHWG